MDDLLTVAKAAELLGMTPRSLHNAIRGGRIPTVKLGAHATLIRREDVEKYKATPKGTGGRPRKQPTTDQ